MKHFNSTLKLLFLQIHLITNHPLKSDIRNLLEHLRLLVGGRTLTQAWKSGKTLVQAQKSCTLISYAFIGSRSIVIKLTQLQTIPEGLP